jgi:hypothetical protein
MTPRCVVPLDDGGGAGPHDRLCGKDATTTRIVDGIEMPLCEEHAKELAKELEEEGKQS